MSYLRHEAEQLDNWVRFEAEYKGHYAHQLTEAIKECHTDDDLKNIIVGSILDRYGMYYTKESKNDNTNRPTKETKKMLDLLENNSFMFKTPNTRNSELFQTVDYLIKSSGLFPTLWKARQIWSDGADKKLMDYLLQVYYESFIPNDDHIAFVKKYKALYQREGFSWTDVSYTGKKNRRVKEQMQKIKKERNLNKNKGQKYKTMHLSIAAQKSINRHLKKQRKRLTLKKG